MFYRSKRSIGWRWKMCGFIFFYVNYTTSSVIINQSELIKNGHLSLLFRFSSFYVLFRFRRYDTTLIELFFFCNYYSHKIRNNDYVQKKTRFRIILSGPSTTNLKKKKIPIFLRGFEPTNPPPPHCVHLCLRHVFYINYGEQ